MVQEGAPGDGQPKTSFPGTPEKLIILVASQTTIVSEEAVISFPNARLLVMNARVERVIRGTLDSDVLKVVTYLFSCSRVGVGHGFVAGTLERNAQRGLELIAIQRPIEDLVRGRANSDSLRRNTK